MVQILRSPLNFSTIEQPSQSFFSCQCFSPRTQNPIGSSIFEVRRKGLGRNRRGHSGAICKKMDDAFYMRRCVELAKKAIGCTSPNPMVGCVIVKDGEIVGQGFHPKAGQPHAEVFALRDAGKLAENATAYVSLEPCNHYGRTPPCTEALINAKIKQVIIGMVDPNPIVASKGVEKLKASGIDVIVGVEEMLCQKLNEAYIHRMHTGKPFVTLRYSLSLDGRLLNHLGRGADEPGGYYSKLAQECDGVVVSGGFLTGSNAPPTSLEPGANQPLQIIIARNMSSLHLPIVISDSLSRTVVVAEKRIHVEPKSEKVETVFLERMNLNSVLEYCGRRGMCSVVLDIRDDDGSMAEFLEEGCCLEEGLVQRVVMELCPVWSGSREASLPCLGMGRRKLKDLRQLNAANESIVLVEGYFS